MLLINHCRGSLPQPIFGLGHSMGATQLIHLALMHPRVLRGLFLIEPIVFPYSGRDQGRYPPALASLRRRECFPTVTAAVDHFHRSKVFGAWDPRVFEMWIKYGLRSGVSATQSPVVLTTSKNQELRTFVRPILASPSSDDRRVQYPDLPSEAPPDTRLYRPEPWITFHNLPYLRPSTMFVFSDKSHHIPAEMRDAIVNQTGTGVGGSGGSSKGKVRSQILRGVGHFAPMEHPHLLAAQAVGWLQREHQRLTDESARSLARRKIGPPSTVDPAIVDLLGGDGSATGKRRTSKI